MLDEMIQDRVESGQLVKGVRGSVRLASERKREAQLDLIAGMEPLKSPLPQVPTEV
jgi:centromeric protein E